MSLFQFGAWYISILKIESVRSNFLIKVMFDVIGVFLAFYTSISKIPNCTVPVHNPNLIGFDLIPKNI